MKRVLVIAPHADDELIGLGGSLLKWKEEGHIIKVVLVACSDIYMHHKDGIVSQEIRKQEFALSCEALSTESWSNYAFEDSKLDAVPITEITKKLDDELKVFQPDVMVYPEPSYHQDHQIVNKACTSSLRPTSIHRPSKVMLYEIPTSGWVGSGQPFLPNLYVDISKQIEKKIELFESIYKSQFTNSERYKLASIGIVNHAKLRGFESSTEYAEAFKVLLDIER